MGFRLQPALERNRQAGLADSRFGRDQDGSSFTGLGLRPTAEQQLKLFVAPNERRPSGAECLKAASLLALARNSPYPLRVADSPQLLKPEILNIESRSDRTARNFVDDDSVRLGHRLQPSRNIGQLSDDLLVVSCSGFHEIADYRKTGRDADAHTKDHRAI